MSEESKNNHIYGFPNRAGQNRYTQSIIEHTSNLFPNIDCQLSRLLAPSDLTVGSDEVLNPLNEQDSQLDDFGELILIYKCLEAPY